MYEEYRKQQLVELKMLEAFINVCEKMKLKYFIIAGTLLGSVRHEGFIPWDDDIDVAMPREDYEIFIKKGQQFLESRYFIQTYITDKNYPQIFAKIRDNETTFIENTVKHIDMNHGMYIDIFPIDGYKKPNFFSKKYYKLLKIKQIKVFDKNLPKTIIKRIGFFIADVFSLFLNINTNGKLLKKMEKLFLKNKYDDCDLVISYGGIYGEREIFPKKYIEEVIDHKFENLTVKVPKMYDEYLTNMYGDYMTPPPEDKRIPHHNYSVLDLHKGYKEYIKK